MAAIAKNIRYLRDRNNLSQQGFGQLFGLTRGQVASYEREENPSEPTLQTILEIVDYFDLDLESFLRKNLWDAGSQALRDRTQRLSEENHAERVFLLDSKAQAGFAAEEASPEFLDQLPAFHLPLPNMVKGHYILIQASGDSMYPTFQDQDWLLARHLEETNQLQHGETYVVLTAEGIIVKRLLAIDNQKGQLVFQSDNKIYGTVLLKQTEVIGFWHIKAKLTFDLDAASLTNQQEEVQQLQQQMARLMNEMDKIKRRMD